jgi:hypothetical protein
MIEQGHGEAVISRRLREHLISPGTKLRSISPKDITRVYSAYRAQRQEWEALPVGAILVRQW